MHRYLMTALLLAATLVAPASAQATSRAEVDRAYAALDKRTRDVVETYLRTDCEIGEVGVALKAVVALGTTVRPYLQSVELQGPPSPVLNDFGRGLESTWQAREAYLRTPDAQELGKEAFDRMRSITKISYVAEQQRGIQAKYQERAAIALRAMPR